MMGSWDSPPRRIVTVRDYNVFISWSLEPSKSVAFVVKRWLKQVIQASNAFMSEADVESGDVGLQAIADQLEAIKVGVFCVTSANQHRPWLNYEAGKISKGRRGNKVIPLLFDIDGADLAPPLGQFQYKSLFDHDDMLKFTIDVARALDADLERDELIDAFDARWPQLHERLDEIRKEAGSTVRYKPREDGEKLDELLGMMRGLRSDLAEIRAIEALRQQSPLSDAFWQIRRLDDLSPGERSDRVLIGDRPFAALEHILNTAQGENRHRVRESLRAVDDAQLRHAQQLEEPEDDANNDDYDDDSED
jgi:hypothetical protein